MEQEKKISAIKDKKISGGWGGGGGGEPKQQLNLKCCPQDECFLLLMEK